MASVKRIGETSCVVPPITGVPSTIVLVGGGTRREIPGGGAFKVRRRAGGGASGGSPRGAGGRPGRATCCGGAPTREQAIAPAGTGGEMGTGRCWGAERLFAGIILSTLRSDREGVDRPSDPAPAAPVLVDVHDDAHLELQIFFGVPDWPEVGLGAEGCHHAIEFLVGEHVPPQVTVAVDGDDGLDPHLLPGSALV